MIVFLKFVGAVFVALILFAITVYFYIRWKFRSAIKGFIDALQSIDGPTVPPFRVKLKRYEVVFDDEGDDDYIENKDEFNARVNDFIVLGFEKIDDYFVNEMGMPMTALLHQESKTYGIVYNHPELNVWCDVVRRYQDETSWTYGTISDYYMDRPPWATQHFFPGESLTTVTEKFWKEAPGDGVLAFSKEEFPRYFEKIYAKEMDWRIERGGVTEAEIRRVAKKDGTECTREQIDNIQRQWRTQITEFFSERVLKRYRKDSQLPRLEWEALESHAVIIHERMQAEELYQAFNDVYYPATLDEADEEDDYDRKERERWTARIEEIRESLKQHSPQKTFRELTQSPSKNEIWELHTSVENPISADIWIHKYEDDEEDYVDDDDD